MLQTPIHDHRKFAVWHILGPYLSNKKGLLREKAFDIIKGWLEKCNQIRGLHFDPNLKIREGLNGAAKKGYFPISFQKLRIENSGLYHILSTQCKPMIRDD